MATQTRRNLVPPTQPVVSASTLKSYCPECGGNIAVPAGSVNKLIVCRGCAGILMSAEGGRARTLRTQEWIDVCCKPGYDAVFVERDAVVARITDPAAKAGAAS